MTKSLPKDNSLQASKLAPAPTTTMHLKGVKLEVFPFFEELSFLTILAYKSSRALFFFPFS